MFFFTYIHFKIKYFLKVEESDTLHTPNVFPHISEECRITSVSTKNQVIKSGITSLTESSTIIQTVSSKEIIVDDSKKNEINSQISIGTVLNENVVIQATPDLSSSNDLLVKSGQM